MQSFVDNGALLPNFGGGTEAKKGIIFFTGGTDLKMGIIFVDAGTEAERRGLCFLFTIHTIDQIPIL